MIKYCGLCENCEYDATCALRRDPLLKIIECEEFSVQPTPDATISARDLTPHDEATETAKMGLCANCQHSNTCAFPNARKNILQCEEYMLAESWNKLLKQTERSRSAA